MADHRNETPNLACGQNTQTSEAVQENRPKTSALRSASHIAALEAALRDAHHQLATRNDWWVTDICPGPFGHTCHRDDTTQACKRIEAVLNAERQSSL